MTSDTNSIDARLNSLEQHLKQENPVLLDAVRSFRELDKVAYATGLLARSDSYATKIPWWPMVSILGTFSSGKSTFINHYIGEKLQLTGNQAVDDKFTVICFSKDADGRVLPGLALDADMRFPFYKISEQMEQVAAGEGRRIDAYLQLKTSASDVLKGKILIDSPGFDADAQRTSTLRITRHIIDLSDLVLVFFDARHPEPGAMHDTLDHLVGQTISRPDSNKFLYILNQIDTTAREDNPEDVVGAWQRALSQKGLTAGRFYCIYNESASVPIEDEALRRRFQHKRDVDLADILGRIRQVEIERAYRIIGALEKTAHAFAEVHVPAIQRLLATWSRRVMWLDALLYGLLFALLLGGSISAGYWDGLSLNIPWLSSLLESPPLGGVVFFVSFFLLSLVHFYSRGVVARFMLRRLAKSGADAAYAGAFRKNTRAWRSMFRNNPVGWGRFARKRVNAALSSAARYVQTLNDQFTNPSGRGPDEEVKAAALAKARQEPALAPANPVKTTKVEEVSESS